MTAPANPTAGPADESPEGDERLAHRGPIQKLLTRPEIGALIGAGTIWVFFWSVSDVFGTVPGANNYLDVSTSLGIMAIAVAMLMIGGEFDLSSGAMTGATGMLVVLLVALVSSGALDFPWQWPFRSRSFSRWESVGPTERW